VIGKAVNTEDEDWDFINAQFNSTIEAKLGKRYRVPQIGQPADLIGGLPHQA
jgi:hypothetical protein